MDTEWPTLVFHPGGSVTKMGGTKSTQREMSVCALQITLFSQVISEQLTGMVKQNGFKHFSVPVFHTVKLLQVFVGAGVLMRLKFSQEVQECLGVWQL